MAHRSPRSFHSTEFAPLEVPPSGRNGFRAAPLGARNSPGHTTVQGDGERELGAAIGLSTRSAGARNGRFAKLSAPPRSQEVDHLPIRLPGS